MTILDRVLSELRDAKGPIRSTQLAARVGVSESALSGMVAVLETKGELARGASVSPDDIAACSGLACGKSCVGLDNCAFVAVVPETTALVIAPSGSG